jgi:hypothetical protein
LFWGLGTFLLKTLILSGIEAKYAKLMPVLVIAPLSFISLSFFDLRIKLISNDLLIGSSEEADKE